MKQKVLAGLLALAMTVGVLSGCGAAQEEKQDSPAKVETSVEESAEEPADEPAEVEEESVEPVEIVWYRNTNLNDDEQKVTDAINEYIEPLIGVRVKVVTNQNTDLPMALAANEDIDLFWTAFWSKGNDYIDGNTALDLTELLPQYEGLYNSMPENIWEASKNNGSLYYVPVYKESATGYGMVVPKELVEKYAWDLSTIHSALDLTPFLEEAHADGMDSAFCTSNTGAYIYMHEFYNSLVLSAAGIKRGDETSTVVNMYETPEYEEYVKTVYGWNQAGYINQDEIAVEADTNIIKTQEGETAFSHWASTPDGAANASSRYGMDVMVVDTTTNYMGNNATFGSAYMINAKTQEADACLKFLELLYTDQTLADLACYGIEGEHYNRTADGRVELIADSGYTSGGVWATTNVMAPSLLVGESENKKEEYDSFNKNALIAESLGFSFDKTPVEAEYTAIAAVKNEYENLLEKGFYDPEEYLPVFQKALKDAGVDKLIEEVQKQYDAWKQAK